MDFKVPTEIIDLPSKGIPYPRTSPLASGSIELKYMTAKEEDILTNINYIKAGTVLDKLFQSMIVTPGIDYNDLLVGDKDMIMVAARILGDGSDYTFEYLPEGEDVPVKVTKNLTEIESKPISGVLSPGKLEYEFVLPYAKVPVIVSLLTHRVEKAIESEIRGLKTVIKSEERGITTRLKHIIVGVGGSRDPKVIREFVDNMLVRDIKPLREFISQITPGVNFTFSYTKPDGEVVEGLNLPITVDFFWAKTGA